MALAFGLQAGGYTPTELTTEAAVTLEPEGQGFRISRSAPTLRAQVPNLDEATFARMAGDAEKNCPVSKVLNAGDHIGCQVDLRFGRLRSRSMFRCKGSQWFKPINQAKPFSDRFCRVPGVPTVVIVGAGGARLRAAVRMASSARPIRT